MAFTPTDPLKAEVRVVGTAPNQQLDFYIPRGPKGDPGGFAASTILAAGTNLDTIITSGLYFNPNSNAANGPGNNTVGGHLEVIGAANWIIQRYTVINEVRETYVRYRNSSNGWLAWSLITTARLDQTVGRTAYLWDDTNNREQLIYGDTGIRRVEADFKNGWTAAIVSLRRVGNIVTFGTYTLNPAARTSDIAYTVPSGFRPASYGGNIAFPVRFSGAANTEWQQITGVGDVYPPTGAISSNGFICVSTWTTSDSWPTTLPGVASGSIPNL